MVFDFLALGLGLRTGGLAALDTSDSWIDSSSALNSSSEEGSGRNILVGTILRLRRDALLEMLLIRLLTEDPKEEV